MTGGGRLVVGIEHGEFVAIHGAGPQAIKLLKAEHATRGMAFDSA